MNKIKSFYAKHKITYSIVLVILIFIVYLIFKPSNPNISFAVAQYADLVQTVSTTGNVKPAKSVDLTFPKTGTISEIDVQVGERVSAGQKLASLDTSEISTLILQAQATLENQQAKLDELKKGTRPEQISVSQADLNKSQQDLNNYYNGAITILNDSYSKADDAVRNQADTLFINGSSDSPQLTISSSNAQAVIDATNQRILVRDQMAKFFTDLQTLKNSPSQNTLDTIITNNKNRLSIIRSFLLRLSDVLNSSVGVTPANLTVYKASVSTAINEVNLAYSNLDSQQQLIDSQKATVQKMSDQLALQQAGNTPEEIAAQEALVKQAQATVENYQAQYENMILRSPFNGIVTKVYPEVGEISSLASPTISLISDAKFEIEAYIPEVDIAKIKIGDSADITLDAYGNDVIFSAKVVSVDPAETIIEGVPTYKTTFQFTKAEDKVKSGMTANIDVKTAEKKNVIVVPQRTVKVDGDNKTVMVLNADGKTSTEVKVETGLRGSDGNIEITSGLKAGDKVIIPTL